MLPGGWRPQKRRRVPWSPRRTGQAQQRLERAREEGIGASRSPFPGDDRGRPPKAASITPDDRIAAVIAAVEPRLPALVDSIVELVLSPPSTKEA